MRNYRIPNGAERSAGSGFILGLVTPYGDTQYTTGFPDDVEIKLYRTKKGGGVKEMVSIKASELFEELRVERDGGL